jgi:preprotein translocase subunit SecD
MSGPEEMIADALREIAAQAGAPRPMADAAWRAGRRRRLAALTASAAAGAAVIVAAVLLPLAAHGQLPSRPPSPPGPAAPVSLRSPIQFRQVAAISDASCPAGSGGLPGSLPDSAAPACFYLTGTGMTVTAVQSAQVVPSGTGGYLLDIVLTPAQTGPFAALTRQVSGLPSPHNQLAVIIDGRVIADPAVQSAIPGGTAQISGFATRAQAESLLSSLRNQ